MQGVVIPANVTSRSREKHRLSRKIDLQIKKDRKREREVKKEVKKRKRTVFVQEGNLLASIKKYADSARTAKR